MAKREKTIDDLSKEELYMELMKEKSVNECLRQEIRDLKEVVHACNAYHGDNHGTIVNVNKGY